MWHKYSYPSNNGPPIYCVPRYNAPLCVALILCFTIVHVLTFPRFTMPLIDRAFLNIFHHILRMAKMLFYKKYIFFHKNPMIRFRAREDKNPLSELIFTYDTHSIWMLPISLLAQLYPRSHRLQLYALFLSLPLIFLHAPITLSLSLSANNLLLAQLHFHSNVVQS